MKTINKISLIKNNEILKTIDIDYSYYVYQYLIEFHNNIKNKNIAILKKYEYVLIQDEAIKQWHSGLFGKQVQNTGIGGIISRLRNNLNSI